MDVGEVVQFVCRLASCTFMCSHCKLNPRQQTATTVSLHLAELPSTTAAYSRMGASLFPEDRRCKRVQEAELNRMRVRDQEATAVPVPPPTAAPDAAKVTLKIWTLQLQWQGPVKA